jgi:hypothetical protein
MVRLYLPLKSGGGTNVLPVPEAQMFTMPSIVVMTMAATRMYRTLSDFGTRTELCAIFPFVVLSAHCDLCLSVSGSTGPEKFSGSRRSAPITNFSIEASNRVEVAVHTTYEQCMTGQNASPYSTVHDNSQKLNLHECVESSV